MERDQKFEKTGLKTFYFNSHAHVERDVLIPHLLYHQINFNSHAHVERDLDKSKSKSQLLDFNSHAHVERD